MTALLPPSAFLPICRQRTSPSPLHLRLIQIRTATKDDYTHDYENREHAHG
jgi:hypothetical protein